MSDFSINDRRGQGKGRGDDSPLSHSRLTRNGMNVRRAVDETTGQSNPFGAPRMPRNNDRSTLDAMSQRRLAASRRVASQGTGVNQAPSMQMASGRPRDPMWYWKQNNIPFNFTEPAEMQRIREYCNTPDAPVTMADGTTKPLGEIVAGDVVKGWDYQVKFTNPWAGGGWSYGGNGGKVRRYIDSTVIAVGVRQAPVVRLTMASGATLTCTPDHKWANPYYGQVVQYNGPFPPNMANSTAMMSTEYIAAEIGNELLNVTSGTMDKVIAIDTVSTTDVISMQTTTGNYVVWGMASKNCRLLYTSHPIVAACIDIFAKFPLQGLHFESKDDQLTDFYSELFFDQLHYEDHLLDIGTEYWNVGEAWPLGGWNDTLGIWESDQLVNPDNVEVEEAMFLNEPRYLMRLPAPLRRILTTRTPRYAYEQIVKEYPELLLYTGQDDLMPVSSVILKQMRFKGDRFSNRGLPILMRGFRTLMQEEMLNSALDSIADRLYTPLILTKLGATAADLGTTVPWIPDQDEMEEFNVALDAALAADFRALTYHWAIDMQPVFGRENVPDLSNDFDRLTERLLMVFGLSQTMLTGASAGETYAADALNRDVVTQLLSHYQRQLAQFYQDRAYIVAEAQEHFDYEVRNGKRYLITEEIYEIDEETGEERIVEQPKLLIPDLKFKILNLTDEDAERQFLESLAEAGVPVPYSARVATTGMDFQEMLEKQSAEQVSAAVMQQETRKKTFLALRAQGLPIPDDLMDDFSPKAIAADGSNPPKGSQPPVPLPTQGQLPLDIPALAPTPDDIAQAQGTDDPNAVPSDQDADMDGKPDSEESDLPQEGDDVPEESNEEKADMPKASSLQKTAALPKLGIRAVTKAYYQPPDNSLEESLRDHQPEGMFGAPKHVGMRRYLADKIPDDMKASRLDKDSEESQE